MCCYAKIVSCVPFLTKKGTQKRNTYRDNPFCTFVKPLCSIHFYSVQNLKHSQTDYGVSADWSYYETSHGKGAVDGVGGTIKQQVLLAVYRGQAVVNSAQTFADTAKRLTEKSAKPIKVIYVSSEEITQSSKLCQDRWMQAPPAPGIRKCHFIYIKDNTPCLFELTPTEVR